MNNIEELNIEYLKINARSVANGVAAISSKWAGETILALIAQLEAAQKERDALKMKLSDAGCLLVEWKQRVEQSERRANTLEAALSAANEKLSKPVVLPPRRSASYFVDEEFSNEDLAAIYNAARLEFSVKVKNAGFTVEGE
ncbi:TPA: hypothetical protein ACW5VC_004441 [Yersinia enterocolitica]|nr:hypothetical protein [Yersinia enterocolitica]